MSMPWPPSSIRIGSHWWGEIAGSPGSSRELVATRSLPRGQELTMSPDDCSRLSGTRILVGVDPAGIEAHRSYLCCHRDPPSAESAYAHGAVSGGGLPRVRAGVRRSDVLRRGRRGRSGGCPRGG